MRIVSGRGTEVLDEQLHQRHWPLTPRQAFVVAGADVRNWDWESKSKSMAMRTWFRISAKILAVIVVAGLWGAPNLARADVTPQWQTVPGSTYFPTADAACNFQWQTYGAGIPNDYGPGASPVSWNIAQCTWHRPPVSPAPAPVYLYCVDSATGQINFNYTLIPPGICIATTEPPQSRRPCDKLDKGKKLNLLTGDPIILATGSLYEDTTDYSDADRKLKISRAYRSKYGRTTDSFPTYVLPLGLGDYWRLNFQWELGLNNTGINAFTYDGTFGVSSPDGSNYAFKLNSDGSVSPQNGGIVDFTVSFVNAGGGAVNYASILANGGQFIIKTTDGDQIALALFVPGNGTQYSTARPTQILYRGGYTWNFIYGSQGEVQTINDSLGRTIAIAWNYLANTDGAGAAYPRSISTITLPDGTMLNYTYESPAGNQTDSQRFVRLKSFSRSAPTAGVVDSSSYVYELLNIPSLLTGIVDNAGVRYATWQYDSQGRVVSAQHAGGADAVTVAYSSDFSHLYRTVTNALGKQTVYTFNSISGSEPLISGIVGAPSTNCAGTASSLTYDSNNNISTTTDEAGNTTTFTYGSDGRLATKTEAYGTALSRATTITWNNSFGMPTRIVAPNRTTDFVYDTAGRLLTRTDTDTTAYALPYSTNG